MRSRNFYPVITLLKDCIIYSSLKYPTPPFRRKKRQKPAPENYRSKSPFKSYVEVLAQLGEEQKFSLGPIYKGRANSLLAQPMKPVSNPNPQFNELYITIAKFGNRIQNVESKLREDFQIQKSV